MYSFINENDAFKLENYIIKWGISKKKAWNTVWNYEDNAYDEKMNRIRAEITDFLNPFFEKINMDAARKNLQSACTNSFKFPAYMKKQVIMRTILIQTEQSRQDSALTHL
jgi:ATP-dependent helicase/DNAse subunit B